MRRLCTGLLFSVACLLLISACGSDEQAGKDLPDTETGDTIEGDYVQDNDGVGKDDLVGEQLPTFSSPSGLVLAGGRVFVTNPNGAWSQELGAMVYSTGYVTVLDSWNLELVGKVEMPFPNPQYAVEVEGKVVVVCSGTAAMDPQTWLMSPDKPGGIVVLDPLTLAIDKSIEIPNSTPAPLAGFPSDVAYDESAQSLFVASGTGPYLYKIDLKAGKLDATYLLGTDTGANVLLAITADGGWLYISAFNEGVVYKIDPESGKIEGEPFKVTDAEEMEGPVDLVVEGGVLYVLHTMSSRVAAVELSSGDLSFPFVTGATANRIAAANGSLFVVNSGDNNLTRFEIAQSKTTTPFAVFEPGTNPWEMATDSSYGYVTGYFSNTLAKVDLKNGEVSLVKGNE